MRTLKCNFKVIWFELWKKICAMRKKFPLKKYDFNDDAQKKRWKKTKKRTGEKRSLYGSLYGVLDSGKVANFKNTREQR